MENYKILKKLGDGTFGSVSQAKHTKTGEIVAIKQLKESFPSWEACVSLSEIKSLAKLNHPNIVQLYEVIKHQNRLYLVFEYLDQNIYQLIKNSSKPLSELEIRNIMFQTLQGIYFMHKQGYFHRDLKPENLLEFKGTIKIADFGLAKETKLKPPFTEYVSTRWYRAPELILGSTDYGAAIDIFAIGGIMAELYLNYPLFPGKNEADQMNKICQILGSPNSLIWPEGVKLAQRLNFNFPDCQPKNLANVISRANPDAIDMLKKMLEYNPKKVILVLD